MTIYYPTTADFVQKVLDAELLSGTTSSATLNNTTSIQNKKGVMIVNRINSNNVETPNAVEVISFDGTSGSTVTTLTRGLAGTTAKDHAINSIVEFGPDIVWAQGLIDTFLIGHDADGAHSSSLPLTTPKITTSINDANGNEVIKTPATTSAVNEIPVTNAATGNAPEVSATGGDTNIDLYLKGKGTGLVKVYNGSSYVTAGGLITTSQYAPQGFLINGKISVSVASNNLTVAIKGMDGNDPSASNPVYCRIGDTVRTITSALSFTLNAGTNFFNAGSAELATKEIDYFVFLVFISSNSTVAVGITRSPAETLFTGRTNTNEKYMHYSGATLPADTDGIEYIGRFAATLSAGAGYTWTVPTFTATNLIQRPIRETRWLSFAPTLTGGTGSSAVGPVYQIVGSNVTLQIKQIGNTSNATTKTFVGPFALVAGTAQFSAAIINITDNSSNLSTLGHLEMTDSSSTISAYKAFYETAWTASGTCNLYIPNLTYRIN